MGSGGGGQRHFWGAEAYFGPGVENLASRETASFSFDSSLDSIPSPSLPVGANALHGCRTYQAIAFSGNPLEKHAEGMQGNTAASQGGLAPSTVCLGLVCAKTPAQKHVPCQQISNGVL